MLKPAKKKQKPSLLRKVGMYTRLALSSNITYGIVLTFFAFQLLWLAMVMNYPALFDEEYHLGIIEIYSRQLSPFITVQPPEAAFHGDITRYGSYLFHYIMSYPYWLISHFTADIKTQVIFLRVVCIGFVLLGLIMWRKFLLRVGVSKPIILVATLFFSLIPLSPLVLSQLNYDSLAFLIVPALFYLTARSIEKNNKQVVWLASLVTLSFVGVLVKFTLLPIAFVCVVITLLWLWTQYKKQILRMILQQFKSQKAIVRVLVVGMVIVGAGFFTERYAVNLIQYKNIEPKCDQVHSRENCMQYTVYRRDTTWRENNEMTGKQRDDPYTYTKEYWYPHIREDFFVTGALVYDQNRPLEIRYLPEKIEANAGIPFLRSSAKVLLIIAIIVLIVRLPYLWRHYRVLLLVILGTLAVYSASLWIRNYTDYLRIGTETAAQGRYFIPLLLGVFALVGVSMASIVRRLRHKVTLLLIGLLIFSQGGGVATYILKSQDSWYWADQRATISEVHKNVRRVLDIFIRS